MVDIDDKKTKDYVNWTVFLLFLLVGLPLWWKTTEVYRAALPDVQIEHLYDQNKINITVEIAVLSEHYDVNLLMEKLKSSLNDHKSCIDKKSLVQVNYKVKALDSEKIEVIPGGLIVEFLKGENKLLISEGRKVQVSMKTIFSDSFTQLVDVVKDKLINECFLNDAAKEVFHETQTANTNLLQNMVTNGNEYEVLISLLISQNDNEVFDWNIEEAIQLKLASFLNAVRTVYDKVDVSSQVLFSNKPYFNVKKSVEGNFSFVKEEQLSNAVNKIESRIASKSTSISTISLVIHMTEESHNPLYIVNKKDQISKSNSFFVPRWGALVLHNDRSSAKNGKVRVESLFPVFVGHLRVLLGGLDNSVYMNKNKNFVFQVPKKKGITDWELDFMMRLKIVKNLQSSVHTLYTLTKSLSKIKDIVISDQVAKRVYKSVESIRSAKNYLDDNHLERALNCSNVAFESSEKAYFDPTLIELLYFPEDQKFAIYCPLFVPIIITLAVSMSSTIKSLKRKE